MCEYDRRFVILIGYNYNKENMKFNSYLFVLIFFVILFLGIVVWKFWNGFVIICLLLFLKNCLFYKIDLVGLGIIWFIVEF